MPTATYIALANITLNTTDAEIVFANIPNTYRDLVVVIQPIGTSLVGGQLRFNGDTGTNYLTAHLQQDGTSISSASQSGTTALNMANFCIFQNGSIWKVNIMDYSATDKHKTVLIRGANAQRAEGTEATFGRWTNTNAITSVTIRPNSGSMSSGTTACLYGIVS